MKNLIHIFLLVFLFQCSYGQDYFVNYDEALKEAKLSNRSVFSFEYSDDAGDIDLDTYRQFVINHLMMYPNFFKYYILNINPVYNLPAERDSNVWRGVSVIDTFGNTLDRFRFVLNKNKIKIRFKSIENVSNKDLIDQLDIVIKEQQTIYNFKKEYNTRFHDSTYIFEYIQLLIKKNVFNSLDLYLIDDLVATQIERPLGRQSFNIFYNKKAALKEAKRSGRNLLILFALEDNEIPGYYQFLAEKLTLKLLKFNHFFKNNLIYIGSEFGNKNDLFRSIDGFLYYQKDCCIILDKQGVLFSTYDMNNPYGDFLVVNDFLENILIHKNFLNFYESEYSQRNKDTSFLLQYIDAVLHRRLPYYQYSFLIDDYLAVTNGRILDSKAAKLLLNLSLNKYSESIVSKKEKQYFKEKQNEKYLKVFEDQYEKIDSFRIDFIRENRIVENTNKTFDLVLFDKRFLDFIMIIEYDKWMTTDFYDSLGNKMFGGDYYIFKSYYHVMFDEMQHELRISEIKKILNYKDNPIFMSIHFNFSVSMVIESYLYSCSSENDYSEATLFIKGLKNNTQLFDNKKIRNPTNITQLDEYIAYCLHFAGKEMESANLIIETRENMAAQNLLYYSPVKNWIDEKKFQIKRYNYKETTFVEYLRKKFNQK
ncbi:MAG: hypothetical protein KBF35_01660 [Saprospiraceae bacterium]|nr:hypothetical protein [Saprospiraceae bacterium]